MPGLLDLVLSEEAKKRLQESVFIPQADQSNALNSAVSAIRPTATTQPSMLGQALQTSLNAWPDIATTALNAARPETLAAGLGGFGSMFPQRQPGLAEAVVPDEPDATARSAAAGNQSLMAPATSLNATQPGISEYINKAKKSNTLMSSLGRGLVEGLLGMPESVAGSSSSIPYNLARLPGDVIRTKAGLPTSVEATKTEFALRPKAGQLTLGQYQELNDKVSRAPEVIAEIMASPDLMKKYGVKSEDDAKRVYMNWLISKFGVNYTSKIKSALGIKSSMDDLATALAGMNPGD